MSEYLVPFAILLPIIIVKQADQPVYLSVFINELEFNAGHLPRTGYQLG
jgi:hypothetical protein